MTEAIRDIKRVIIASHSNADPDAVGAMVLVSRLLDAYGVSYCHYIPEGPSKLSKILLEKTGKSLKFCENILDLDYIDAIIVVDSSNPSQLGELADRVSKYRIILFDHHQNGRLSDLAFFKVHDSNAASTTELISVILEGLDIVVDEGDATLALAGILYDSRRFRIVGEYTFQASAYLWRCGASIIDVETREEMSFSERYARIKAAARSKPARICGDIIVVVTHVGSYESSVARGLIDLGADVVAVVGGHERLRVSIRISRRALDNGIRADELARYIAEKYGGEGGGHMQAAMTHLLIQRDPVLVVEDLSRSLPGKAARLCVRRRQEGG